jgi:hypothetical protein
MRTDGFQYVKCILCQRSKSGNTQVGLHSANPAFHLMERLFIDFVGPLSRTKRGNIAILIVVDGFCKFVSYFVKRITSAMVIKYLEFFPAYGIPESAVTMRLYSVVNRSNIYATVGVWATLQPLRIIPRLL